MAPTSVSYAQVPVNQGQPLYNAIAGRTEQLEPDQSHNPRLPRLSAETLESMLSPRLYLNHAQRQDKAVSLRFNAHNHENINMLLTLIHMIGRIQLEESKPQCTSYDTETESSSTRLIRLKPYDTDQLIQKAMQVQDTQVILQKLSQLRQELSGLFTGKKLRYEQCQSLKDILPVKAFEIIQDLEAETPANPQFISHLDEKQLLELQANVRDIHSLQSLLSIEKGKETDFPIQSSIAQKLQKGFDPARVLVQKLSEYNEHNLKLLHKTLDPKLTSEAKPLLREFVCDEIELSQNRLDKTKEHHQVALNAYNDFTKKIFAAATIYLAFRTALNLATHSAKKLETLTSIYLVGLMSDLAALYAVKTILTEQKERLVSKVAQHEACYNNQLAFQESNKESSFQEAVDLRVTPDCLNQNRIETLGSIKAIEKLTQSMLYATPAAIGVLTSVFLMSTLIRIPREGTPLTTNDLAKSLDDIAKMLKGL